MALRAFSERGTADLADLVDERPVFACGTEVRAAGVFGFLFFGGTAVDWGSKSSGDSGLWVGSGSGFDKVTDKASDEGV